MDFARGTREYKGVPFIIISQGISNLFDRGPEMRGIKMNNMVALLTIYYFSVYQLIKPGHNPPVSTTR